MSALDKLLKKTQEKKDKEKTISRVAVQTPGVKPAGKKSVPSIAEGKSILTKEGSNKSGNKTPKRVSISTPSGVVTPEPAVRTESESPQPSTRSVSPLPQSGAANKIPWIRLIGVLPSFSRKDFEDVYNAIIELLLGRRRLQKPETMSKEEVEAEIKVSLDSSNLLDSDGMSLKERLLDDFRVEVKITKNGKYFFTFVRNFKKLDTKEDLLHILTQHACVASDYLTDANKSKGVLFSDLIGYYFGIEEDIVSLMEDRTVVAVNVANTTGGRKHSEQGDDETIDDVQLRDMLRNIAASRQSCASVRLFLKLNATDELSYGILSEMDLWPKGVHRDWRAPQLVSSSTAVIQENNEKLTFAPFKRMEKTGGNRESRTSKKTRKQREYGGFYNAHMKEPDKIGLAYDFKKPFRVSEAEERYELLQEYKLKRSKREEGEDEEDQQGDDFNFEREYGEDSEEGSIE